MCRKKNCGPFSVLAGKITLAVQTSVSLLGYNVKISTTHDTCGPWRLPESAPSSTSSSRKTMRTKNIFQKADSTVTNQFG